MQENWVKIESIFRTSGIYFELRSWVYFCLIEGRHFYYSPNSGKWRMKGKRAWHFSTSPEDFMASAKVYSPPDYQSRSTESYQQKSYSNHSSDSSSSDHHQQKTEDVAGIRSEFLSLFAQYLQQQRKRGYKIGWIWYKLTEEFTPSTLEICWLSVIFHYSPGWAFYKIRELHGFADLATIFTTIKIHKQEWLSYFEQRWGIKEEPKQKQQQHKQYKQQKTSSSRQHRSTASTLAHQAYLQLLGLTVPFTHKDLKKAYRQRALETHPDSGGSAEAFRQIHHAYQTLTSFIV